MKKYMLLMLLLSCTSSSLVVSAEMDQIENKDDALIEEASGTLQQQTEKYTDHLRDQWGKHSLLSTSSVSHECTLRYTMRDENELLTISSTLYLLRHYGKRIGDSTSLQCPLPHCASSQNEMADLPFIQHLVACVKADENTEDGVCLYLYEWPENLEEIVNTVEDDPTMETQRRLSEALFTDSLASQTIVRRVKITQSLG